MKKTKLGQQLIKATQQAIQHAKGKIKLRSTTLSNPDVTLAESEPTSSITGMLFGSKEGKWVRRYDLITNQYYIDFFVTKE